ncbi:MAG: DMT family transporter [Chloroflexota bacterium]
MSEASIDRRRAILFLVVAAVLWSTSGLVIKQLSWQPLAVLAGRSIFSGLVFLVYLRRFPWRPNRWQLIAAGSYILTQFLYISALKLTTAANAIFLQYSAPVYIVLLGYWLLREKPTRADWVAMGVVFAGLGLFFGDNLSLDNLTGVLLALLSGVFLGLMTVALRAQKDGAPAESFLVANAFSAVFGFYFVWQEPWTASAWAGLAYLGIFQVGLSFVLYSIAIRVIPALEATLIGTLEPVLNPVWVFLFVGERPGPLAVAGGLVVLAGIVLSALAGLRGGEPPAAPEPAS